MLSSSNKIYIMTYTQKLSQAVVDSNSTLCVGLDPNLELLPASIKNEFSSPEEQVLEFCKQVIDVTKPYCAAYKPNIAFFESLGAKGLEVFEKVLAHIPSSKVVIVDAKRGDISSTAEHYEKAFFQQFDVDAVTLNPLMGFDTLQAFSSHKEKAIYVLTLTSNTGAADFLKQSFVGYDMMSQYIADNLCRLSKKMDTHLGMVIGATQAELSASITNMHKKGALLIPGVGAQGGSVQELAKSLKSHEGIPLINSSRAIIYAGSDKENWTDFVAKKAQETQELLDIITQDYV